MASTVPVSFGTRCVAAARVFFQLFLRSPLSFLVQLDVNPLVHGDGVGYPMHLSAPLIPHKLGFQKDRRHCNLVRKQSWLGPDQSEASGEIHERVET